MAVASFKLAANVAECFYVQTICIKRLTDMRMEKQGATHGIKRDSVEGFKATATKILDSHYLPPIAESVVKRLALRFARGSIHFATKPFLGEKT